MKIVAAQRDYRFFMEVVRDSSSQVIYLPAKSTPSQDSPRNGREGPLVGAAVESGPHPGARIGQPLERALELVGDLVAAGWSDVGADVRRHHDAAALTAAGAGVTSDQSNR
jgi:hypothetical protein